MKKTRLSIYNDHFGVENKQESKRNVNRDTRACAQPLFSLLLFPQSNHMKLVVSFGKKLKVEGKETFTSHFILFCSSNFQTLNKSYFIIFFIDNGLSWWRGYGPFLVFIFAPLCIKKNMFYFLY